MIAKAFRIILSLPFLVGLVVVLFIWLSVAVMQRSRRESEAAVPAAATRPSLPIRGVLKEVGTTVAELALPPPPSQQNEPKEIPAEIRKTLLAVPAPLSFYAPAPVPTAPKPPPVSTRYLPYGTLIPCKLVNTVDSTADGSPVVAIVLEDMRNLDEHGESQIVIPAGTFAILDSTAAGHERDRIAADGRWIFVWRTRDENNGLELPVEGRALSRDYDPVTRSWGHADGRAGLRGELIRDLNAERIDEAANAAVLGGLAALREYDVSSNALTGQVIRNPLPSLRNAGLGAVEGYVSKYSDQIREQIQSKGAYVQVTAGTEFYIFPRQTIDLQHAKRGATAQIASAQSTTTNRP